MTWACGACTTSNFYQWNPTSSAGTTEDKVLGVEDALWSEHLRSLNDAEFLMYTRMMATAEVGWDPAEPQGLRQLEQARRRHRHRPDEPWRQLHKATEVTSWKGSYAAVDNSSRR